MIISDRQLKVTKEKIVNLVRSVDSLSKKAKDDPFAKGSLIQTQVLVEQLNLEVKEYEELKEKRC